MKALSLSRGLGVFALGQVSVTEGISSAVEVIQELLASIPSVQ